MNASEVLRGRPGVLTALGAFALFGFVPGCGGDDHPPHASGGSSYSGAAGHTGEGGASGHAGRQGSAGEELVGGAAGEAGGDTQAGGSGGGSAGTHAAGAAGVAGTTSGIGGTTSGIGGTTSGIGGTTFTGGTGGTPQGGVANGGAGGSDNAGKGGVSAGSSGAASSGEGGIGASSGGTSTGGIGGGGIGGGGIGGSGGAGVCYGEPFVECPCLKVTLDGDDTSASASLGASAFGTVQAAIDFAAAHPDVATNVCVAPAESCGAVGTFPYGIDLRSLTMADGVSVYGNFESSGWTRCSSSTTVLHSQGAGAGISFGPGIVRQTILDGFEMDGGVGTSGATVLVDGAQAAVLSNVTVSGYGQPGTRSLGILAIDGAHLTLLHAYVPVNSGGRDLFAVAAEGAVVTIDDSNLFSQGQVDGTVAAVELADASGSSVSNSSLRVTVSAGTPLATQDAAAVRILGEATGIAVAKNTIAVSGSYNALAGIVADDCVGTPSVEDNQLNVNNPGFGSPQAEAVGVRVTGGACSPTIVANQVTSAGGAMVDNVAISCSAPCSLERNSMACDKTASTAGAVQGGATGLVCVGCSEIRGNQVTGLVTPSGIHLSTIYHARGALVTGPTLVAQNAIHGGCGADTIGLTATGARIENNLITGRAYYDSCGSTFGTYASSSIGLQVDGGCDVHSNNVFSTITVGGNQTSVGVVAQGASLRNNFVVGSGAALAGSWSALENNAFDGAAAGATNATDLNLQPGAAGNIFADCTTSFDSPCIDAGTLTGAPADDYRGVPRDAYPDIGAYEYVPGSDPCEGETCSGHGSCGVLSGVAICNCSPGYARAGDDPLSCVPDPCFNNGGCDYRTTCTPDGSGGRNCGPCPANTTGTGDTQCVDIDECATDNGGCDPLTTCTNVFGSYSCGSCPPGYTGNGYTGCVFLTLCNPNPCLNDGTCWSDGTTYACNCNPGLMGQNCQLTFTALAGNDSTFCGVRSDGTLRCWGRNLNGEADPPSGLFTAVDLGDGYGCALGVDGSIACFGYDADGRTTPPTGTFSALSTGRSHACAIRTDGTLACWGNDAYQAAEPPSGTFEGVAAGSGATCAIRASDHSLVCWGDPTDGGTAPPAGAFQAVDLGGYFGCALKLDGTLACWGRGGDGQTSPPGGTIAKFQLGWGSGVALDTGGVLTHWGFKPVGMGTTEPGTYSAIGEGTQTECGVHLGSGTLQCWGKNDNGMGTPPSGLP